MFWYKSTLQSCMKNLENGILKVHNNIIYTEYKIHVIKNLPDFIKILNTNAIN